MSQDERLMILQMVADKKITASEGAELLRALDAQEEAEAPCAAGATPEPKSSPRVTVSGLGSGLSALFDEVIERVTGVLGDINGPRYSFPTEINGVFTADVVPLRIFSGSGQVEVKSWDEPGYRAQILVKARAINETEARRRAEEAYLVTATESAFQLETNRRFDWSDVTVHVTLFLPKDRSYRLETRTGNGDIRLEGLTFTEAVANSGNGRITVRGITADRLYLKSGNGPVEVDGDIMDLEATTGNGALKIIPLGRRSERLQLKTGNGSASIDTGRLSRDVGLYLDAHTGMGNVSVARNDLVYERDDRNIGNKHVIAHSQGYDGAETKVEVRVRTGLGSISIE